MPPPSRSGAWGALDTGHTTTWRESPRFVYTTGNTAVSLHARSWIRLGLIHHEAPLLHRRFIVNSHSSKNRYSGTIPTIDNLPVTVARKLRRYIFVVFGATAYVIGGYRFLPLVNFGAHVPLTVKNLLVFPGRTKEVYAEHPSSSILERVSVLVSQ